ncbi:diphthamide biosynthesis protein [Irpex rosettiformis]|uniref:Diphthamide biosynthesis protein n=1 Tax=Irpex rosettiformis TaxID=378272 RepID=A0ACB8TRK7_9APHY|nr:diphthamide biosynthesis protein [Irpex rosettiformis]
MDDPTTLYASGEEAITRVIEVEDDDSPRCTTDDDYERYYDIQRTMDAIITGDYKRIALQFPDELLHDSVPIFRLLKDKLGPSRDLYVLADTSYGSCCVDEVAAQHVEADAMVHYGHACMSQTSRLPVVYVFGRRSIDIDDCIAQFSDIIKAADHQSRKILLRTDVRYSHVANDILAAIKKALPECDVFGRTVPLFTRPNDETSPQANTHPRDVEFDTILFVGSESLTLTNLLMTNAHCQVYSYDPKAKTAKLESVRSNRLLMRRYAVVQRARDADVFGILVGTLGVASYLPLISRLRSLLARYHKKSYTITVGKLNPAKLGNFLEIECFVLVACPENSLVEAKEFLRPIITPYELEIALQDEPQWIGEYELDFGKLAPEESVETNKTQEHASDDEQDRPLFSLVTGQYRQAKRYGVQSENIGNDTGAAGDPSALVLRNQNNAVSVLPDSAAGRFLQSRTYRGLETRVGEDAPSVLEQGRSGIARGYQDDHR